MFVVDTTTKKRIYKKIHVHLSDTTNQTKYTKHSEGKRHVVDRKKRGISV